MLEQLKVKPSVDCHHPASVISAATMPAARCGPAVEGLIPRRPHDKIGVAAAYARVGDNARGFDSDIGSFGNFFYPVRRVETMVDGAHSHLPCFSLPCQRHAFSRSVIRSRRSMSSSIMSFSGRITSVVCRARPYRRSSNSRTAAIRALSSLRFASLPG
jgi:hypothetical protein